VTRKVSIQYRQLKTEGFAPQVDLKALLVDVLRRRKWDTNARLRIFDLDQDQSFVILNKMSDPASWDGAIFSGQIIHVNSGTDVQAILQPLDEDTDEFVLKNLNIGELTRVLKGTLYFAIVGNHVALIEDQQVRGRTLERYLTALLQGADELEPGQAVILNGKFTSGDGKELRESSEITLAAIPNSGAQGRQPVNALRGPDILENEVARETDKGATVFDVLAMLGWNPGAIDRLRDEVPDDGWIEGFFRVFIKQRNKKKPISRATINEALRNIDPADLGLRGDGSEKGGIVKLSTQRVVKTHGSLLDPADAMDQIVTALREWSVAGKIDCKFDE
jgi:hypothetical protein